MALCFLILLSLVNFSEMSGEGAYLLKTDKGYFVAKIKHQDKNQKLLEKKSNGVTTETPEVPSTSATTAPTTPKNEQYEEVKEKGNDYSEDMEEESDGGEDENELSSLENILPELEDVPDQIKPVVEDVNSEIQEEEEVYKRFKVDFKLVHDSEDADKKQKKNKVMDKVAEKLKGKGTDYSLDMLDLFLASEQSSSKCDISARYRSFTGSCNNLLIPTLGEKDFMFRRVLPHTYILDEPGTYATPRGGYNSSLPNPRKLSLVFHHELPLHARPKDKDPEKKAAFTSAFIYFGQAISHDIHFTQFRTDIDCCNPELLAAEKTVPQEDRLCFPVNLEESDVLKRPCIPLIRATPSWKDMSGGRERNPTNLVSSFIDASFVYGINEEKNLATLREKVDGKMKENSQHPGFPVPFRSDEPSTFLIGDPRGNIAPMTMMLQALCIKEHNRLAGELKPRLTNLLQDKDPAEQDNIIFQEARRLLIAQIQNIFYNDFLRILFGPEKWAKNGISTEVDSIYNPEVDPTITLEFNHAYRFGHSLIPAIDHHSSGVSFPLRERIFDSGLTTLVDDNHNSWKHGLLGASQHPCMKFDSEVVDDLTDFLTIESGSIAQDLTVRNIQRGRDTGTGTYSQYREMCGLSPLTSWEAPPPEISAEFWARFKSQYASPTEIDVYIGMLTENVESGVVGPTIQCILEKQFLNLKTGDRFFFTHVNGTGSRGLQSKAKNTVRKRNMGDLFCDNLGIPSVTSDVFKEPGPENSLKPCTESNKLNFDDIVSEIFKEYGIAAPEEGSKGSLSSNSTSPSNSSALDSSKPLSDLPAQNGPANFSLPSVDSSAINSTAPNSSAPSADLSSPPVDAPMPNSPAPSADSPAPSTGTLNSSLSSADSPAPNDSLQPDDSSAPSGDAPVPHGSLPSDNLSKPQSPAPSGNAPVPNSSIPSDNLSKPQSPTPSVNAPVPHSSIPSDNLSAHQSSTQSNDVPGLSFRADTEDSTSTVENVPTHVGSDANYESSTEPSPGTPNGDFSTPLSGYTPQEANSAAPTSEPIMHTASPGMPTPDAGMTTPDTGMTILDTGMKTSDAGMKTPYAGMAPPDSGMATPDTGMTTPDTGMTNPHTGMSTSDAGMTTPNTGMTTPYTGIVDIGMVTPGAESTSLTTSLITPSPTTNSGPTSSTQGYGSPTPYAGSAPPPPLQQHAVSSLNTESAAPPPTEGFTPAPTPSVDKGSTLGYAAPSPDSGSSAIPSPMHVPPSTQENSPDSAAPTPNVDAGSTQGYAAPSPDSGSSAIPPPMHVPPTTQENSPDSAASTPNVDAGSTQGYAAPSPDSGSSPIPPPIHVPPTTQENSPDSAASTPNVDTGSTQGYAAPSSDSGSSPIPPPIYVPPFTQENSAPTPIAHSASPPPDQGYGAETNASPYPPGYASSGAGSHPPAPGHHSPEAGLVPGSGYGQSQMSDTTPSTTTTLDQYWNTAFRGALSFR